jgi:ABC-type ATPase with predicted acetyltransferase domain
MLTPFPTPPIRSPRAAEVARLFGLRAPAVTTPSSTDPADARSILPPPGTITLVTGPSGSGKSSLLRAARAASQPTGVRWLDLDRVRPPDVPLVDAFDGLALNDALDLLARVGLAEAWTWLRTPAELSAGQRWRLRLALGLHRSRRRKGRTTFLADEFAALLDRVTACVLARALRRAVRAPLSAVVATSHEDLTRALAPDLIVRCDFGSVATERCDVARESEQPRVQHETPQDAEHDG